MAGAHRAVAGREGEHIQEQIQPYVLTAAAEQALTPGQSFAECATDCPVMVVVPAGSFMMGSPSTERGRYSNEGPQHRVTIAEPFGVSKFALTFDEWDACVAHGDCPQGVSDGGAGRVRRPVINVTWDHAQRYVAWFSRMTGKPYRLLSEAEYEYAARAGTQTAYPWGDEIGKNNANCSNCGSQWDNRQTAPVGSFAANKFGLYDMVGNVWAWITDCAHENYNGAPTDGSAWIEGSDCKNRVARGGGWSAGPELLRSASRGVTVADRVTDSIGFRLGRTLSRSVPVAATPVSTSSISPERERGLAPKDTFRDCGNPAGRYSATAATLAFSRCRPDR